MSGNSTKKQRDWLGVAMILVAALFVFGVGTTIRQVPWLHGVPGRLLSGALLLLAITLIVRLTIRLVRWVENRARQ
jgi:hypothetical protein